MPTFRSITREFPGAIDARDFVYRTLELLRPYGFDADNGIACVGVCRDEITRPLIDAVVRTWGEAFNFSSLAGMLTLGRTGFAAARSHAPQLDGRERKVFITMPHIGVDGDGTLGRVQRRGQHAPTPACGALILLANELHSEGLHTELDLDDIEQSLVRRRLEPLLRSYSKMSELEVPELTRIMRRAILEDLEHLIERADMVGVDYAVFSGVQIHTPDAELVWPADAYVVVDGRRTQLSLADE